MSKYPCLHVNTAVFHNILQLLFCVSNSAKRNQTHKAPVWNLNESLPEIFSSIYPILSWMNKCLWNPDIYFPSVHIPTGQYKGGRNVLLCMKSSSIVQEVQNQSTGGWDSILGKYHDTNPLLKLPWWSSILDTLITQGVVLRRCYKQLFIAFV